ncbi:hypothetical protein K7432_004251 [Basidiobolus ranarum]|uniref:Yeast cell wall synthesis Kre9/Knh1-like N-terminal domain-containing protein n=1 Tax=Basidiobolus ranarum TaxID=34480 RepID=A0ABR2W4V9_9FUNG
MKSSILYSLALATCLYWSAEAIPKFDKHAAWGKRDYSCLEFNTPAEGSRLKAGQVTKLNWKVGQCGPSGDVITTYDLQLYNSLEYGFANRQPLIKNKLSTKIVEKLSNQTVSYSWKVPHIKQKGVNANLYYIRVTTSSESNPQKPSLFGIAGPFTISS